MQEPDPGSEKSIVADSRNRERRGNPPPPSLLQIDAGQLPKKEKREQVPNKESEEKEMAKTEEQVKETEVQTEKAVETPERKETQQEDQRLGIRQIREAQSFREMEELRAARSNGEPSENEKKVIGMQSIKKKDGSGYAYKLFMTEPYTVYEKQHGECLGVKVCDEYVGDESKIPADLALGDIIKITKIQRGQFLSVDEIRILNR